MHGERIKIQKLVVFWLVSLYFLFVYIEHDGDESPKDTRGIFNLELLEIWKG